MRAFVKPLAALTATSPVTGWILSGDRYDGTAMVRRGGQASRARNVVRHETSHPRIPAPVARLASCRPLAVRAFVTLTLCFSMAMLEQAGAAEPAANVDANRIAAPDPANWPSYGRTYSEQRFSPLSRINADNAPRLGLAWYADLDSDRGQEATPLVIDGVLYVSTAWSIVKAFDAKTGALLWSYDPAVPRALGVRGCCDVVSRGVAAWKGKIFVATFDGRLAALDARTGKPVWTVMTVDPAKPYTITQAPRAVNGRVVIGNSGGEYGVRGYISAYDAETGALAWRFYTVPGDPSLPFENQAMAEAAKTWDGEWWKSGGGGVVWDAISYDPELNLVYFGVGNGMEWDRAGRSANKGDNLFLSSIVALNADTGDYVWHFQATPGEEWDYDAVQQLILADLTIGGERRQVLMQANKNGFLLRSRPQDRKADLGQGLRVDQLGQRHRRKDRPPDRASRDPLHYDRQASHDDARPGWRPYLASDGVQPDHEAGLHP